MRDPAQVFRGTNTEAIPKAIVAFLNHSLHSDLISNETRQQRINISLKAIQTDPYLLQRTFYFALSSTQSAIFTSVDFVLLADQYANDEDHDVRSLARCIIAVAIARLEDTDYPLEERWAGIIQRRLNWSEAVSLEQRDSIKLCNLVRLARELHIAHPVSNFPLDEISRNSLCAARQLNVGSAAPHLQHDFCDLWNELVAAMQARPESERPKHLLIILSSIATIYFDLHQGTESQPALSGRRGSILLKPSSYRPCVIPSHRYNPPQTPDESTFVPNDTGAA